MDNVPEDKLYEGYKYDINSAGWALGHLIVEAYDVFNFLEISVPILSEEWIAYFKKGTSNKLDQRVDLPSKNKLMNILRSRYDHLMNHYLKLTNTQRQLTHSSKMLKGVYSNLDSWYTHHLVTHVAVHIGNIVTWKKVVGLETDGV